MIKPEFWDDEKLSAVSRDARLMFIGMWTHSDDYGVVKGHPAWLKNKIFPYEEIKQIDFIKWLKELEKINCILSFNIDGEKYYYIRTFITHQTINRPSAQRNPEPPQQMLNDSRSTHGALTDETETETEEKENNARDRAALSPKIKYLDSVFLTDKEYSKLQEAMGQKSLEAGIEKLDYSLTVKKGKFLDHYKTLLNWHKRGFIADYIKNYNGNGNGKESVLEKLPIPIDRTGDPFAEEMAAYKRGELK
jgi:hypothetical protein